MFWLLGDKQGDWIKPTRLYFGHFHFRKDSWRTSRIKNLSYQSMEDVETRDPPKQMAKAMEVPHLFSRSQLPPRTLTCPVDPARVSFVYLFRTRGLPSARKKSSIIRTKVVCRLVCHARCYLAIIKIKHNYISQRGARGGD